MVFAIKMEFVEANQTISGIKLNCSFLANLPSLVHVESGCCVNAVDRSRKVSMKSCSGLDATCIRASRKLTVS